MANYIFIPARLDSKRLPNKPLLMHKKKALLHYTYEAALKSDAQVLVVTSDKEIIDYCDLHNIEWVRTEGEHWCGTTRVKEACEILNLQNDDQVIIHQVDYPFFNDNKWIFKYLATDELSSIFYTDANNKNENDVKVVVNKRGRSKWFSRFPISPYIHVGVYAYLYEHLKYFIEIQGYYAKKERLEQLNQLDFSNLEYMMYETIADKGFGVNTAEDWEKFKTLV